MEEQSKTAATKQPPVQEPQHELPLDTRMLSDAVIELNISRKNVGIYPPGHIQITKSIARAYDALLKLFEVRAEMTLGVAKDTLFVGHDYLDRANPVYRDFALSLYNQGVAAVTFMRGLDQAELTAFHRIITTRPEDIRARGGIAAVAGDADIPHVRITPIDYAGFHVTDEREISQDSVKKDESPDDKGVGVWGDFVSHLSAGTIAISGKDVGVSLQEAEQIDPAELARLLNERKLDPNAALKSYDSIISGYVRTRAEQKHLNRAQSDTLRNLNNLLKDLHPELRKQFLAVTFERTSDASPAVTEEVVGGLTDDMVIDMLQQASSEGKEISPTLTGVLQKLASAGDAAAADASGTFSGEASAAPLTQEQVQALFNREKYEQYVSTEYAETLGKLSRAQPADIAPAGVFPIDEYVATMTEERLDYQIGRVLLGFIDEDIPDDDYGEFLKKVISNMPELVRSGQFALLHDTYETLRLHVRDKKSLTIQAMVDVALRGFRDPAFIGSVLDAWGLCANRERARAASNFLLSLGPDALPQLFELYGRAKAAGGKRAVFDLLCRFGNAAVQEAVQRLGDKRPYYVRNLLMLIRWGWDASVVTAVRPLVRHEDAAVRLEAVGTLLRFRDSAAIPALRTLVQDKDPDVTARAAELAGQYRVRAVVDLLLAKLKRVILFESDYRDNEDIIRILGEIGDAKAVPELERIAKGGWPLFPKSRSRMKATLFESLERYPRRAVAGLIAIGMQSGDPRIDRACAKLGGRKP